MPIELPTEKTPPSLTVDTATVLLYGDPKVGKSSFCAGLDPDHTLFLACEPGLGGLETFSIPIKSWQGFREANIALSAGSHEFTTVVIDTVDVLARLCLEQVCVDLGVTYPQEPQHWNKLTEEFRLRVGQTCSLGLGVWFISHARAEEIKSRVGTITKLRPDISSGPRRFLVGFVDLILYATSEQTKDGERRLLRTAATENYDAGGRYQLTDPLPLDAAVFRKDFERVVAGAAPVEVNA